MNLDLSIKGLMEALARLKDIPLAKVVRNAARDYVQGGYKATPVAQISKSEFYVAKYGDRKWFIHESMLGGKKPKNVEGKVKLRKVRIMKGWSKSTWIGAFRALGISPRFGAKRLPNTVEHKSYAIQRTGKEPVAEVTSDFRVNDFGKVSTKPQHERIAGEGFKLASHRITQEYLRLIRGAWK